MVINSIRCQKRDRALAAERKSSRKRRFKKSPVRPLTPPSPRKDGGIPQRSTVLVPEALFALKLGDYVKSLDKPSPATTARQEDVESALLQCDTCQLCVHASKYNEAAVIRFRVQFLSSQASYEAYPVTCTGHVVVYDICNRRRVMFCVVSD